MSTSEDTAGLVAKAGEKQGAPRFVGSRVRQTSVLLEWPVEYAGKTYDSIGIKRLTAKEVSDFTARLDQEKVGALRWPVFVDSDGASIPDAVMDALDDDDNLALQKVMLDFLPRRFRPETEAKENASA